MPYIGNRPADPTEADNFVVDNFTAGVGFTAGSSTTVTLSTAPATENAIIVTMDGVTQHHDTYSVSGTTLTFDATIPSGITNIEVQYYIKAILTTVADGSVTSGKLAGGAVTSAKLDTDAVTTVKVADSAITYNKLDANTAHYDRVTTVYTQQHQYQKTVLTPSGNVYSWNLNTPVVRVNLTANNFDYTVSNPTNKVDGGTYLMMINVANTAGTNTTISWGNNYCFTGNTYPTITANTNATDIVSFVCDGYYMFGNIAQNYGKN